MKDFLHHLLLPRESNNHRPKILHHKSLLFLIICLFIGQFFLEYIKSNYSQVLGASTNISVEELLVLTNEKRNEDGLATLTLNGQLSSAALLKAKDMFSKNYWAHNSPDGITPWFFIKEAGYNYVYAGENLARGFTSSKDVVNAWMASPLHKENILSKNYKDIGFAVLEGKLNGEDGVLIVEMFGGQGQAPIAKEVSTTQEVNAEKQIEQKSISENEPMIASVKAKPIIDTTVFSKSILIFILSLFISILILDMIIIERKKIIRIAGHNIDHILFLSGILILVILFSKGITL